MTETCRCGADLLDGRCIAYCLPIPRMHRMRRSWVVTCWICAGCGLVVYDREIASNNKPWLGEWVIASLVAHKKAVNCGR